uniref:Ribosomal protein S8 n=1 Tax=Cyanoptyche gloeocystis TaxID=77922 RepID=A0A3G1IWJ5_9EUKA|nr:ribosomal protein S8 [Cyanoptyche gloeocystis]
MLTRIRNANLAKHEIVCVKATKINIRIIEVLKEEGFIQTFEQIEKTQYSPELLIKLKYKGNKRQPVITALKRISKPGLKIYAQNKNLPKVLGGLGTAIISTSAGIMTDKKARVSGYGGEIICYIW